MTVLFYLLLYIMEVARDVVNGAADVAFDIREAASKFDLEKENINGIFTNMTLLSMLLMSLTKNRKLLEGKLAFKEEYDYVIVGAGTAGSVMANRLTENPCITALVLEAGGTPPLLTEVPSFASVFHGSAIDWDYQTESQQYSAFAQKGNRVIWNSGKALGGSSALNAMLYVRGNMENYNMWVAEGATGWSYKDVFPYFLKLEDNRNIPELDPGYHSVKGPMTAERVNYTPEIKPPILQATAAMGYQEVDSNGRRQTGMYDTQATVRNQQRCSTAKAYLEPASDRPNLDILPYAFARKIPLVADLPVGKNLQDHVSANLVYTVKKTITPVVQKNLNPLNILDYIVNRRGSLTSPNQVTLMAFLDGKNTTSNSRDFPRQELYFTEYDVSNAKRDLNLKDEVYQKVYAPYELKPLYMCYPCLLQPYSRGEVTLKSADPNDPPNINPNYYQDERDLMDVVEGMKICNAIAKHPAMQQVQAKLIDTMQSDFPGCEQFNGNEEQYFSCLAKQITNTFWHPVGTARMGSPDDTRSVVDPQLRVIGVKNLRVINAAVMPIIPSGNTNVPTMMVAEKAYDMMKGDIKCEGKP